MKTVHASAPERDPLPGASPTAHHSSNKSCIIACGQSGWPCQGHLKTLCFQEMLSWALLSSVKCE